MKNLIKLIFLFIATNLIINTSMAGDITDKDISIYKLPLDVDMRIRVYSNIGKSIYVKKQDISKANLAILETQLVGDLAYLNEIRTKHPTESEFVTDVLRKLIIGFRLGYIQAGDMAESTSLTLDPSQEWSPNIKRIISDENIPDDVMRKYIKWYENFGFKSPPR